MKIMTFLGIALGIGVAAMPAFAQPAAEPARQPSGAKSARSNPASEVDSIIKLTQSGVSESLIIKSLQRKNQPADLSTSDLIKLKQAGVTENVISAMMDPTASPVPAAPAQMMPPPVPIATVAPPVPAPAPVPVAAAPPPPVVNAPLSPLPSRDWRAAIQDRLERQFPLTQPTADKTEIVTAGAVLVLKKNGLVMYTSAAFTNMNTYKNGSISQGIIGKLSKNATDGSARTFVRGEKFWITQVDVKDDGVVLQFLSDPMPESRYSGALKFPFPKGTMPTADQIAAAAAEVLAIDKPVNPVSAPAGQTAPAPQQAQSFTPIEAPPPPPDQPAAAPGSIGLGQTKEQIGAVLGKPSNIATDGNKQIYTYGNIKVTFVNGKATNIE